MRPRGQGPETRVKAEDVRHVRVLRVRSVQRLVVHERRSVVRYHTYLPSHFSGMSPHP